MTFEILGIVAIIIIVYMIMNDFIRYKLYIDYCKNNNICEHYLLRAYVGSYPFCYDMDKLYNEYVQLERDRVLELSRPEINGDEDFFEMPFVPNQPTNNLCFPELYYYTDVKDSLHNVTIFDSEIALATFLANDVVFLNENWWKDEWPEDAKATFAVAVNAGDTFAYACADAEDLTYAELEDLWDHFVLDENYGPMVWVCKKRKMKPIKHWCVAINATGIWNIDEMGLADNPHG